MYKKSMDGIGQPDVNGRGDTLNVGPTWKWLVGILLSVIGVGIATGVIVVWNELGMLTSDVQEIKNTLVEIKAVAASQKISSEANRVEIQKLWERVDANERTLMSIDFRTKVLESDRQLWIDDDRLLHNWVHPDDPHKHSRP